MNEFTIEIRNISLNTTEFYFDIDLKQTKVLVLEAISAGHEVLVLPKI